MMPMPWIPEPRSGEPMEVPQELPSGLLTGGRAGKRVVTVEFGLWVLIALVALALRAVNLRAAPLSSLESREALHAWRAATGQGMPAVGYSPLLLVGNALLFSLVGASDTAARLWPVLFGTSLVLLPLLYRRRIGRMGALVAGICLTISPTALFASRQVDGAVIVAVGVGAIVGGAVRFLETGRRSWLGLSAIALALSMVTGSSVWGALLPGVLAATALIWDSPAARASWLWRSLRAHLRYAFLVGVVGGLALCTGFGWNVAGVGAVGDLLSGWLGRVAAPAKFSVLVLLAVYEPLALFLGVAGLIWAVRYGRRIGVFLGGWVALGIVTLLLVPPRSPVDVVWIVLPLALLAGAVVESVLQTSQGALTSRRLWPYAMLAFGLWVYFYLRITRYALYADANDLILGILALVFPVALLLFVSLLFVFTAGQEDQEVLREIVTGSRTVLHGAVVGTLVALAAYTASAAWGVAHVRAADPSELLVSEPTSPQVHILTDTLHEISWRETGTYADLAFAYASPGDSVVTWYLRDFPMARRVDILDGDGAISEPVLVTLRSEPAGEGSELTWQDPTLRGQDFVLARDWNPQNAGCYWERDPETDLAKWPPRCDLLARWLFLRQSPKQTQATQWAVLWVR
jgi:uncharacterized protein (TIGR03663 family)